MATRKPRKTMTPEQKAEMAVGKAFAELKNGLKKIDEIDPEIQEAVENMAVADLMDSKKALMEEFETQKNLELVKLTIASHQAKRIDKVSDIAYSYYQYTGRTIDPELLSSCVVDLEEHVLAAATLVAEWTFEEFCVDNDEWENPMNGLLPEYEPGMNVEDVWWQTYLFHDMSGHGQSAASLHMKIDELISQAGLALKDELRKVCLDENAR